ncbi:MAG TPA: glycosyltransferase, partial [Pirellulaceae bacterium]|nr:glycosyltransferase [Pirellulaceae bacterium]
MIVPEGVVTSETCLHQCPFVAPLEAAELSVPAGPGVGEKSPDRRRSARKTARSNRPGAQADGPLVSCIMPTGDRREFAILAIRCFLEQDYGQKELVIVDDGAIPLAADELNNPQIRCIRLSARASIGAKRNLACREARGAIIVQWDDDDWHGPRRLSRQ